MEPKVNIHAISIDVIQKCMGIWFQYAVRNYETVKNAINEDKAFCLGDLGGKHTGKPGMVIGSGPTLKPSLPFIKDWQEKTGGIIYCSLSNINLLMAHGIKPAYFVIYDFRDKHDDPQFGLNTAPPGFFDGIPMIIPPEYDPGMIKFWLGLGNPVYFVLRGTFGDPDKDPYINYLHRLLPAAYIFNKELRKPINYGFLNCGCVANQEILCASHMGCDPIYLCGVNFGYPQNKAHIKPMVFTADGWVEKDYIPDFTEKQKNQFEADNGVLTDPTNIMYKHATLCIWLSETKDIYDLTIDGAFGIIDLIPKIDIKDLAAGTARHEKILHADRQKLVADYRERHGYKPLIFNGETFAIPIEDDGLTNQPNDPGPVPGGTSLEVEPS